MCAALWTFATPTLNVHPCKLEDIPLVEGFCSTHLVDSRWCIAPKCREQAIGPILPNTQSPQLRTRQDEQDKTRYARHGQVAVSVTRRTKRDKHRTSIQFPKCRQRPQHLCFRHLSSLCPGQNDAAHSFPGHVGTRSSDGCGAPHASLLVRIWRLYC